LPEGIRPPAEGEKGKIEIIPITLSCLHGIGHVRIFLPKDLKSSDQKATVRKSLMEVQRRFPDGIALLDPIENMSITDEAFKKLLRVNLLIVGESSILIVNGAIENRGLRIEASCKCFTQLSTTT